MKVIRMIQVFTRWDRKRQGDLCRQSNMLLIVQVINKNKLRWFGHVVRREEESTVRVVMKLSMKGKRQRGRPGLSWLDNIDSHLKGNKTSPKEVLEMKEFWRRSLNSYLAQGEQVNTSSYPLNRTINWFSPFVLLTFQHLDEIKSSSDFPRL